LRLAPPEPLAAAAVAGLVPQEAEQPVAAPARAAVVGPAERPER
jgi:hypothetical protein